MMDAALFTAGSLFSQDYLVEGVKATQAYQGVDRRLRLRAKLDALYFILYGIFDPENAAQSRDDIRYIFATFPIVERQEIARWGTYRSRDLALAWINALMAGQPDAEVAG